MIVISLILLSLSSICARGGTREPVINNLDSGDVWLVGKKGGSVLYKQRVQYLKTGGDDIETENLIDHHE